MKRRHAEEKLAAVAASFKAEEANYESGRLQEYRDQGKEEEQEEDSGDEGVGVVGITQLVEDHDEYILPEESLSMYKDCDNHNKNLL